ncbi:hypothetical protein [Frigoriglobus tundricola]|uniref:Uncharacterized protein n=1 Tax=Frigoriglobus tundricola TaxID=2774151 RepID=A0A6M5YZ27_9BACT|nr:hypothetical protein [Frigoriglobus tundricola]QJW98483.1 hypothetical protein FTUN_6073 [Frigoriglobus tundricola]
MTNSENFEPFGPSDPLRDPVQQVEQKRDRDARLKNPAEYVQRLLQLARPESTATRGKPERPIDRWHWPTQLACSSATLPSPTSGGDEVIIPYCSPAEEADVAGTRAVKLQRSTNRVWTLRVLLTGAAATGRLARFSVGAPPGGEPWTIVCFVGTDENGIGELSLRRFDPRRQWKLAPGCTFTLEPLTPRDLQPDDRTVLEKSRDAALIGREALEAVLAGLLNGPSAE